MRTISILALDTASPSPAVTLLVGETAFDESLPSDRHASEHLLAGIESCFSRAGLSLSECTRIAVCAGPGSFTGVRVGLATAWGLGRALDCPVESVSTLEAIAEAARSPARPRLAAALDAGREEIVWQAFDMTGPRAIPLAPAARASASGAAERAFDGLPYASVPADLAGPGSVLLEAPVSRALALAVARRPADGPTASFAAIYSRPSAAEEKRGAP
ncbi:MAG: tRNA (adenosine(37)-N6)-threonylcarbamoyltransferase complex dimerization subunit type 1 TsaB [Acidobacteria bacterium]|nr:tRNA (adenosine(37)-N6)-threonylcarbamoyltransferase complex dimerization subunit type 1 TsaB [Acidobacteriota bacterium]MCA1610195.1 tRNA (adenosine(37)-N6)-threonylcarbamoyltransferase complex dimerization subunit type 1 TsaB [Acidobacteriota bacterium]